MKLKYSKDQPSVDYETAKKHALVFLKKRPIIGHYDHFPIPAKAAQIADAIWPKHQMTPQGSGGAATRILKRMEKEGLVHWIQNKYGWGWAVKVQ